MRLFPADRASQRLDCDVNPTALRFKFLDDSVQILHAVDFNPTDAALCSISNDKGAWQRGTALSMTMIMNAGLLKPPSEAVWEMH
jgi:hypothetical protein